MAGTGRRAATHTVGVEGEEAAAQFLEAAGYTIRDRNVRCVWGEIDLVAELGELLCFVEVRTRSEAAWGDPAQTVSWAKQQRVVKTAMRYIAAQRLESRLIRFDVIAITGQRQRRIARHIPNAFDAGF